MGDFRIDRRGTFQPGNVSKRQPQQRPAEPTPGGNPGALNGFGDAVTPELAERLRERRERQPKGGPGHHHGHSPKPGGPGEGPGPNGRHGRLQGPDSQRPFVGRQPIEPAKAAEDLFTQLDANGDGAVTKGEVTAFFEAKQAKRQPAAPAEPIAEEAVVESPVTEETVIEAPLAEEAVVEDPVEETAEAEPLPEETAETQAELYAQAQAQAISELQAFVAQDGLPEEFLALATQVMDAIYALDPADAEFETQLNAAFEPLQTALAVASEG